MQAFITVYKHICKKINKKLVSNDNPTASKALAILGSFGQIFFASKRFRRADSKSPSFSLAKPSLNERKKQQNLNDKYYINCIRKTCIML